MKSVINVRIFLPVVLVGLGFSLGAAFVHAQQRPPEGRVTSARELCTKTAAHGKAWVTPYVEGHKAWLGRLELAAGAKVPEHQDSTEEYIHVLSGHGTMRIDGKTTEVGPGDTVYMPANARVSFENGRENLTALQVFAGPAPAAKYASWTGCK